MFHIILYQPEIPPNTGNVIRLCGNTGTRLHLVEPLGFSLDEKSVRRAGMDYAELAVVQRWADLERCLAEIRPGALYTLSSKSQTRYTDARFRPGDALLFGPETRGLPPEVRDHVPESQRLTLPMVAGSRSLNLGNSVSVVLYEAWRQNDFNGARLSSD
ncbi:MAG: tRNA (cytidine(34)-2'-O)-methyltransferase [Pseudomonadota bacterium]